MGQAIPKQQCLQSLNDIFKHPKGTQGPTAAILHALGNCLANHNITLEEYDKAIAWLEGEK